MTVLTALWRNPIVFLPVLLWTFIQIPVLMVEAAYPGLASALSPLRSGLLILATPFVHAGLIGMADEALDGDTALGTFVQAGKDNYVSVLSLYLLFVAVNSALGIFLLVGALVLFLMAVGQSEPVLLAVVGGLLLLVLIAYLLVLFFVQFYGHAIVIEELGVVEGVERSISRVRRHLLRTVRYSVVGSIVGLLFTSTVFVSYVLLIFPVPAMFGVPLPQFSTAEIMVGSALILGVQTLAGGSFTVYSVAYYHDIRE